MSQSKIKGGHLLSISSYCAFLLNYNDAINNQDEVLLFSSLPLSVIVAVVLFVHRCRRRAVQCLCAYCACKRDGVRNKKKNNKNIKIQSDDSCGSGRQSAKETVHDLNLSTTTTTTADCRC